MRQLTLIFGMKRCGNHALTEWMKAQSSSCLHINNQIPFKPLTVPKHKTRSNKDYIMVSYEDRSIRKGVKGIIPKQKEYLGSFDKQITLLILRDPYNMFASRLKHAKLRRQTLARRSKYINMWISYAREYLNDTKFLPNKIVVNFNKWFISQTYRHQISELLGLEFTDAGLNKVARKGHGSSFDKMKYDGKAQEMDVLNRWKNMIDDKEYISLLRNRTLIDLSQKIFNMSIDL